VSCHISKGKNKSVAFVFSCPGRYEQIAGHPAAKVTGTNLSKLLTKLNTSLNRNDLSKREITITNAWNKVEYEKLTGRSEAKDSEILGSINISRLNGELKGITEFIVCCGNKSKTAIEKCNISENVTILYLEHLGTRGLNTIKQDVKKITILSAEAQKKNGDKRSKRKIQLDNTSRRLDVVCEKLVKQLNKNITKKSSGQLKAS